MTALRFNELQRRVLRMAYAPDYLLCERQDPWDTGPSRQTLAALERRGLLRPAPGGDWEEAQPTAAGIAVLGLDAPLPRDLARALEQAIGELVWHAVERDAVHIGEDVPSVCVDEDWATGSSSWTDTTGVIAAVHDPFALHDSGHPLGDDGMVAWSAVARRLSEAGWRVQATLYGDLVYLEPDDS